jgi:hypothetical protein
MLRRMVGEVDWEVFAAHLRAEGEEHLLDQYPEYAAYLKRKNATGAETDKPPEESAGVRIVERIVERQVLVIRCTKCRALVPAELPECRACGAPL